MEIVADLGVGLVVDAVVDLAWIVLGVVEFVGVHEVKSQLVALGSGSAHHLEAAEAVVIDFVAGEFGKYHIVDLLGGVLDLWVHARACEGFWKLLAEVIHDGRS